MRQRYFSPENLTQSQQYTFSHELKPQKRLRSNGSVTTLLSYPLSNTFQQNFDHVGNYKIDLKKQIGSGYSSKVYKGYTIKDSHQVAVKILNIKKFSPSSLQMVQNEIKILQSLNHPNILKCFDVYKTANQCYIITQLCSNGDLQTYMTRKGILQQKQAIDIISQVTCGVKHLFKNGIIHRDLKPANILYTGKYWKIADFGFAIQSECQITTKHNVGTPLYMPPEALIKNLYSPQSDIFSIGIILYQMLIGVTPWQCSSQKQLIRRLTSIPLKIPSKFKITSSIKHLLQRLCNVFIMQRMNKQQFLNLNFNNFSSIDILNTTYTKQTSRKNISKKLIDNKKSQTKSKSKKKTLIKVTSKDMFNNKVSLKPNISELKNISPKQNISTIIKSSSRSKQGSGLKYKIKQKTKSKQKNKKSKAQRGNNQYMIVNDIKSVNKNRRRSKQSSILQKRQRSISKQRLSSKPNENPTQKLQATIYQQQKTVKLFNNQPNNNLKQQQFFVSQSIIALNSRIIINQLQYCRFMYYFTKNINFLNISEINRQKIGLIVFKHLIRIIKLLSDNKNNWFGLVNWQGFIKTKKYIGTLQTITEYSQRYQKQYLAYIKYVQISAVRQINQKIPEISNIQSFSVNLYNKILNLVSPLIHQINNNLSSVILNPSTSLDRKTQAQIEGLCTLIKYYRLIQMSKKQFQNYSWFEQNSQIYFLKDFRQSSANSQVYFKIKDQIKSI